MELHSLKVAVPSSIYSVLGLSLYIAVLSPELVRNDFNCLRAETLRGKLEITCFIMSRCLLASVDV